MRRDHRRVTGDGNHGVLLVDRTLPHVTARMRVNVTEHLEAMFAAMLPERRITFGMEGNCA